NLIYRLARERRPGTSLRVLEETAWDGREIPAGMRVASLPCGVFLASAYAAEHLARGAGESGVSSDTFAKDGPDGGLLASGRKSGGPLKVFEVASLAPRSTGEATPKRKRDGSQDAKAFKYLTEFTKSYNEQRKAGSDPPPLESQRQIAARL